MEIIPAILPQSFSEIENKVARIVGEAQTVQIDLCDGVYVENKTWPFNQKEISRYENILAEKEGLPFWEEVNYELDLMILNAKDRFEEFVKLGPSRIIFHLDAEKDLKYFFENLDIFWQEHIEFGLAIGANSDISKLDELVPFISVIQCMGINHIGLQGQKFNIEVYDLVEKIKKMYPNIKISIDGGVVPEIAPILKEKGAASLVSGSYIFNSFDTREAIEALAS